MKIAALCSACLVLVLASLFGCTQVLMRDMAPIGSASPDFVPSAPEVDARDSERAPGDSRLIALFVAGSRGTEITDLLAPWAVLAESGLFDLRLVAASREPVPLTGRIFAVPDLSFDEVRHADLIVIPAVVDPGEPALVDFLRREGPRAGRVLSVCVGAEVAAAAGLLRGLSATTHFFSIGALAERFPEVRFAAGHRYVEDGSVVSSAGVTAGADAALHVVERVSDRATAEAVAKRLGLVWQRESDPHAREEREATIALGAGDLARIVANFAGRPWRRDVAVWVAPGTSEIALAAALDALPRTLRARVLPFSLAAGPAESAHGMRLLAPQVAGGAADASDVLVIPTGAPLVPAAPLPIPSQQTLDLRQVPAGAALGEMLRAIAEADGLATARYVAKMLEAPLPVFD